MRTRRVPSAECWGCGTALLVPAVRRSVDHKVRNRSGFFDGPMPSGRGHGCRQNSFIVCSHRKVILINRLRPIRINFRLISLLPAFGYSMCRVMVALQAVSRSNVTHVGAGCAVPSRSARSTSDRQKMRTGESFGISGLKHAISKIQIVLLMMSYRVNPLHKFFC